MGRQSHFKKIKDFATGKGGGGVKQQCDVVVGHSIGIDQNGVNLKVPNKSNSCGVLCFRISVLYIKKK